MLIPKSDFSVSGIGCVVLSPDSKKVFVVEGDRHLWPDGLKDEWSAVFHPIIEDPQGKKVIKGAPFQVITVKETLEFLGKTYEPADQAGAIVEYCITKGWFPKCCFTLEAAVDIAKSGEDYAYTVETSQLLEFHTQLMDFTARVANHHYMENIFGAIDGEPTTNEERICTTLYREAYEEFNLPAEILDSAQFLQYSPPREARKTGQMVVTAYFVVRVDEEVMLSAWHAKMLRDRTTGNEWRCALPWYKFIGDIDIAAAKCAKSDLETGPVAGWHPVQVHPNMDTKNRILIELFTAAPCVDEPAAKRQRAV